jgi:hypothetical protein
MNPACLMFNPSRHLIVLCFQTDVQGAPSGWIRPYAIIKEEPARTVDKKRKHQQYVEM